jgi:single-stranded-DNA-specific exonuclease
MNLESNGGICVYGDGWHEGVLGIVAGRIKEKFCRPSFVISFDAMGNGKGSARSVPGFHLGHFFKKAKEAGIIIEGGGHALAGGFSVNRADLAAFNKFLSDNIEYDYLNQILIDYEIKSSSQLSFIAEELKILEPFGKGMEKPLFLLNGRRLKSMSKTKMGAHLMVILSGQLGERDVKGIIFNISSKSKLVYLLERNMDSNLDVIGFIGSSPQFGISFQIEDAKLATPASSG